MFVHTFGIGCFSHTLANVGEAIKVPQACQFLTSWKAVIKSSKAVLLLWQQTNQSIKLKTFCQTRWRSWWEVLFQLVYIWPHVVHFIQTVPPKVCEESIFKMCTMLIDAVALSLCSSCNSLPQLNLEFTSAEPHTNLKETVHPYSLPTKR